MTIYLIWGLPPKKNNHVNYDRKILVDLENCEIKNFDGQIDDSPKGVLVSRIFSKNALSRDPYKNTYNCTYVIFKHDDQKFIGGPFNKTKEAIRFILMEKKYTYLYINRSDNSYFFDLNFIPK